MVKICKIINRENSRLYFKYNLLFFLVMVIFGCTSRSDKLSLRWENHLATGINIPAALIKDHSSEGLMRSIRVNLTADAKAAGILGDLEITSEGVLFKPLVALSPGISYYVFDDDSLIGNIRVPLNKHDRPPLLAAIYPAKDTLPENQLKFYFHFSKPMRAGEVEKQIHLIDKAGDTLRNVFLNLEPELWDSTGTTLTLWLDPGRIKRDLVLNRQLGNPLKKNEHYLITISRQWKDTHGLNLTKDYIKSFSVGSREEHEIVIDRWRLTLPQAQTHLPLIIHPGRSLDHYLLQESILILDSSGSPVKGRVGIDKNDQQYTFVPAVNWKPGSYTIRVNANLEDLAGNNLNRVFDRDIYKDVKKDQAYYERKFELE